MKWRINQLNHCYSCFVVSLLQNADGSHHVLYEGFGLTEESARNKAIAYINERNLHGLVELYTEETTDKYRMD